MKITKVDSLQNIGKSWVLNLQFIAKERTWNGEDRIDQYDGCMFFSNEADGSLWAEQLTVERVIDVRWGTLEGLQMNNGSTKGRYKARLYPDIRHTIPK